MRTLLLGVDGGGTRSRAQIADCSGRVLGTGSAGTSNYQVVGLPAAVNALAQAVEAAAKEAGLEPAEVEFGAACFGLAGADRPADVAALSGALAEWGTLRRLQIVNDAELVLAAASIDGAAIALISGTGSICYGRDAAGNRARSGGWGHLLGDEGSGYDLALRALRLATQTADGRAQAGEVLRAVLEQWGLSQAEDLIPFAYQRGTTRAEFAELAWPILALAEAGDEPAQALVAVISCELARQADAVGERLGLVQPLLAFGGGLLLGSRLLRQLVVEHLHIEVAGAVTVDDPCRGALRLAEALLGAERAQERPA